MKAISLWQPWASLIAVGAKQVETRHWKAPAWVVGQRVGIHAAKTTRHLDMATEWPFGEYLAALAPLPLGALVATVVVDRCSEMTHESIAALEEARPHEREFGHYEPGRFAWVLRDVIALPKPVPFKGAQGFFDIPEDLLIGRAA